MSRSFMSRFLIRILLFAVVVAVLVPVAYYVLAVAGSRTAVRYYYGD